MGTFARHRATFKGTETVDGRQADRYGYTYEGNVKNVPATSASSRKSW